MTELHRNRWEETASFPTPEEDWKLYAACYVRLDRLRVSHEDHENELEHQEACAPATGDEDPNIRANSAPNEARPTLPQATVLQVAVNDPRAEKVSSDELPDLLGYHQDPLAFGNEMKIKIDDMMTTFEEMISQNAHKRAKDTAEGDENNCSTDAMKQVDGGDDEDLLNEMWEVETIAASDEQQEDMTVEQHIQVLTVENANLRAEVTEEMERCAELQAEVVGLHLEVEELEDLINCKICRSQDAVMMSFPCRHLTHCNTCYGTARRRRDMEIPVCPICQRHITKWRRVHRA